MIASTVCKNQISKVTEFKYGRRSRSPGYQPKRSTGLAARARRLLELEIKYVPNDLFNRPGAETLIERMMAAPNPALPDDCGQSRTDLPAYLAALYQVPLLSADEERYLFCRMNFCRHRAVRAKSRLSRVRSTVRRLGRIEADLAEAGRIRNRIIRANLRLVVAVAKSFTEPTLTLDEFVSDGNLTLIRAVELFDFARGNRFSTYATGALRNRFLRTRLRHQRALALSRPFVDTCRDAVAKSCPDPRAEARLVERRGVLVARLFENLSDRERAILRRRFGMSGDPNGTSFCRIASELGLSKERVRQLAIQALDKLKVAAQCHSGAFLDTLG